MEKYTPLPNYAALGGRAEFEYDPNATPEPRLVTTKLEYGGNTYDPRIENVTANKAWGESRLVGWIYAEKAIIASLLSMTNLVVHVKDLHLELAATFQAVTVDAFANDVTHPVRRLLDQFTHRSVQATNDNFKLLFEYRAAEFSLAPLPTDEQLRLIDDAITNNPLNLAALDMENFAGTHNMKPSFSVKPTSGTPKTYFWRWHYRALTVQRLLENLVECWFTSNFPNDYSDDEIKNDATIQAWWASMVKHLPALQRAVATTEGSLKDWAKNPAAGPTRQMLKNVMRTIMVWVSWIHEDVGHSAAAYVYNPIHTPMCVPEDGHGVPLASFAFNAAAYRGFVFLERAVMLDAPAPHWFDQTANDKKCYTDFQDALRALGNSDASFSECDETGFYSCVNRVETAVSS